MKRTAVRLGAATVATSLLMLSMAPAHAATVSQASATALQIGLAGNPAEVTGITAATNDGSGEVKTGEPNPPVSVLQNQLLANVGVLAQDATARVLANGNGNSAACAGVAGNGGSVAEVGDSNCITPGQPVGITLGNLDLTGAILINPDSALGALSEPLQLLIDSALAPITAALTGALPQELLVTGISGGLGAVEARCVASPGTATGTANIVDTSLGLNIAGEQINLLTLPVNPAPNTDLLVNLDDVVDKILEAVETSLRATLTGQLQGLALLPDALTQIRETLVGQVLSQIAPQLAPLSENVLKVTLNKQTTPQPGAIQVTALSLELLPAAAQFIDSALVNLQIGEVTCGPNGVLGTPPVTPEDPEDPDTPGEPREPRVPTRVPSGVAGEGVGNDGMLALGGLVLLAMTAGVIGYRRSFTA